MKFDKKLMLIIVLRIVGIFLFILTTLIRHNHAIWILLSIILLSVSVVVTFKWCGKSYINVVIFIFILFEIWAFIQILFYRYSEIGTVIYR